MAYLEIGDFLGLQVAQDLVAHPATQVCLAKRWVLSVFWVAVPSTLVIKWTHEVWVSDLTGHVGSACLVSMKQIE